MSTATIATSSKQTKEQDSYYASLRQSRQTGRGGRKKRAAIEAYTAEERERLLELALEQAIMNRVAAVSGKKWGHTEFEI